MSTENQINDGGPAFPDVQFVHNNGDTSFRNNGMSLRDWFAGQALVGIVSNADLSRHLISAALKTSEGGHDKIAAHAYAFADAMLAARNSKPTA